MSGLGWLFLAGGAALLIARIEEKRGADMAPRIAKESERLERGVSLLSSILTFFRDLIAFFTGAKPKEKKESKAAYTGTSYRRYPPPPPAYDPYEGYSPGEGWVWG